MSGSSKQAGSEKGRILPSPTVCSVQALTGLDDAHPPWGGQLTLLSPPIPMLTDPEIPSQTHPEMCSMGTLWPARLTYKINHHGVEVKTGGLQCKQLQATPNKHKTQVGPVCLLHRWNCKVSPQPLFPIRWSPPDLPTWISRASTDPYRNESLVEKAGNSQIASIKSRVWKGLKFQYEVSAVREDSE